MTRKLIILTAAIVSLAFGDTPSGKIYRISLAAAAKVAGNPLAPGGYALAVDTASIRMVEVKTGKAIEIVAEITTGEKKFDGTAITTQTVDGQAEIRQIRLGGTKIQIDFR
jgi:hypothetical protein